MKKFSFMFGVAILIFASVGLANQETSGPYKVLKTVKVGGRGGWDYITADVEARRLYVPRSDKGHLTVYDLDTLDPVGEIASISSGGAAIDPVSHQGFSTTKPVTMWDTKSLGVIKTIPVKNGPDGILFDPYNERVWVFGGDDGPPEVSVIDGKRGTVVGTVDLGGNPEQAVSNGNGTIYVNLTDKSKIAVVDANTLKVTARYDLSSIATNAGGLAFDAKNHILFSYLHKPKSVVVILNADNGNIITTLPCGDGVDTVAFNPNTMEAISTDGGSGTITVIKENSPTSFVLEQTLQTMRGARTMVLDTKTGHIATVTAKLGPTPPPLPGGRDAWPPIIPNTFTLLLIGR